MKRIVEQYLDGFRSGDPQKVLQCLSDEVVWRLHGCRTFNGKPAFAANITNDEFCALPALDIQALIEEENRVVAIGSGAVNQESGGPRRFVFSEVFLFDGLLIREIDTFHIWADEREL